MQPSIMLVIWPSWGASLTGLKEKQMMKSKKMRPMQSLMHLLDSVRQKRALSALKSLESSESSAKVGKGRQRSAMVAMVAMGFELRSNRAKPVVKPLNYGRLRRRNDGRAH